MITLPHAWFAADPEELECGREMFTRCRASALKVLTADNERLDYPAAAEYDQTWQHPPNDRDRFAVCRTVNFGDHDGDGKGGRS